MKDPAFLFYSSDFLSGVSDLTMEERGQYITLLCVQHQKGVLTEKTIRLSVGSVSVFVLNKFFKDENGNYLNKRLEKESEKRTKFTESRRNNGKKGGRPPKKEKTTRLFLSKPTDNLMGNINESSISNNIFNFKYSLLEYGFKEELINDWLIVRKNKKSSNTETSFKSFISEIEKTNCDKNEILRIIVENSWSGFKAVWYEELLKRNSNGQEQSPQQSFINAANSDEARSFEFSKGNN